MRRLHRHAARGFTLIELMVTVAIVAILAAVALPSYRDYLMRGYLVDGTTLLSAGRVNMERYFQDNRTYLAAGGNTPPCAATPAASQGYFSLSCPTSTLTATSYILQSSGRAGTPVANFTYTIDQTEGKTTVITANPGWNTPTPAPACWIVKKGMSTCPY